MPKSDSSAKRKLDESTYKEREAKLVKTTSRDANEKEDLIVLGLSYKATEDDVKSYFETFGTVSFCEIKRDPASKRSKGFAFIRFEDESVIDSVVSSDHKICDRRAEVRFPKKDTAPKKLFVGRLPADTTTSEVEEAFSEFGELTDCYLPKPFRGFGFITFKNSDASKRALEGEVKIKGAKLNVSRADPKKKEEPFHHNVTQDPYRNIHNPYHHLPSNDGSRGLGGLGGPGGLAGPGGLGGLGGLGGPGHQASQDNSFNLQEMMKLFNNAQQMKSFASFLNASAQQMDDETPNPYLAASAGHPSTSTSYPPGPPQSNNWSTSSYTGGYGR